MSHLPACTILDDRFARWLVVAAIAALASGGARAYEWQRREAPLPAVPPNYHAVRCLEQAPVITVTPSEITYQGQLVANTHAVTLDDSPHFRIDALYERLDAAAHKIFQGDIRSLAEQQMPESCSPIVRLRVVGAEPEEYWILKIINTAWAADVSVFVERLATSAHRKITRTARPR